MNDYYYDNDNTRTENSSYYDNNESTFNSGYISSSFTVGYVKVKTILLGIFIFVPYIFLIFMRPLFSDVYHSGNKEIVTMFVFIIVLSSLLFLYLFISGVGKKIIIVGNSITIRKYFIFSETFSISNVSLCEVITGLVAHSKYGSRHYNKIVLHYNGDKKLSLTDDVYDNWNKLADYMQANGKATYIDGRSKMSKFIDNMFK